MGSGDSVKRQGFSNQQHFENGVPTLCPLFLASTCRGQDMQGKARRHQHIFGNPVIKTSSPHSLLITGLIVVGYCDKMDSNLVWGPETGALALALLTTNFVLSFNSS